MRVDCDPISVLTEGACETLIWEELELTVFQG